MERSQTPQHDSNNNEFKKMMIRDLNMSLTIMDSKIMLITIIIVERQDASNNTTQNVEEETIKKIKTQKVSEHGNMGKESMMIMMK